MNLKNEFLEVMRCTAIFCLVYKIALQVTHNKLFTYTLNVLYGTQHSYKTDQISRIVELSDFTKIK
jgi:hypothetical protein